MKPSFFARHSLTILFVAVFLMPFAFGGAYQAFRTNRNDVEEWLPSEFEETTTFRWFQRHFAGEQFILASWEGCTLDDQRLKLLTEKLSPSDQPGAPNDQSKFFQKVTAGPDVLARLTQSPSSLSHDEAVKRLTGSLIGADGAKTCVVFTLSEAGAAEPRKAVNLVRHVASQECNIPIGTLHMGGPPVDNTAIDETGETSLVRLASLALVIGLVISWFCLRDVKLVALVFVSGVYSAAISMAFVYFPGHAFWGTNMNAILLTMPALVYVAAVSGAIHLSNYYRDSVLEHGVTGAPDRAVSHASLPLALATCTTVVGLLTLYCRSVSFDGGWIHFEPNLLPIRLFGVYSAAGVAASVVVLCLFLPACFQLFPYQPSAEELAIARRPHQRAGQEGQGFWWRVADFIVTNNKLVASAGIVVLIVGALGMERMQTSIELMRMFPKGARILNDYTWLEDHLGKLVPMEVVVKLDRDQQRRPLTFLERMELIEQVERAIAALPEVGSAMSAVTFAPPLPKPEGYRSGAGISGGFRALLGGKDQAYRIARKITSERLEKHRDAFMKDGWLKEENGQDLWRINARVGFINVDYHQFVDEIRHTVETTIDDFWQTTVAKKKPVAEPAEDEPAEAAAPATDDVAAAKTATPTDTNAQAPPATEAVAAVTVNATTDQAAPAPQSAATRQLAASREGVDVVYTGLVPLVYKSQRDLFNGLKTGYIMDLIVVTIIMMICVREWSTALVLPLPSVFPVFVVFGVMGWAGIVVDTGTVMAPAVALGVTVDDVVHFMLMYRSSLKRGNSRREALMISYQGCARAMYQSWGVIGLGMSVFILSPFTPTQRFGFMMVTLLTAALFGNLVVLPAVLAGPIGGLFGRQFLGRHRQPAPVTEFARPRSVSVPHAPHHEPALPIEAARRLT